MLSDITEAEVQLAAPQATSTAQKHIPTPVLQAALSKAGAYTITEAGGGMHHAEEARQFTWWFSTYKPILIIGAFITGTTLLLEASNGAFDPERWMSHFMAAFFLTISFFKLLDVRGFAESYATYDVIAKRWQRWGFAFLL